MDHTHSATVGLGAAVDTYGLSLPLSILDSFPPQLPLSLTLMAYRPRNPSLSHLTLITMHVSASPFAITDWERDTKRHPWLTEIPRGIFSARVRAWARPEAVSFTQSLICTQHVSVRWVKNFMHLLVPVPLPAVRSLTPYLVIDSLLLKL